MRRDLQVNAHAAGLLSRAAHGRCLDGEELVADPHLDGDLSTLTQTASLLRGECVDDVERLSHKAVRGDLDSVTEALESLAGCPVHVANRETCIAVQ